MARRTISVAPLLPASQQVTDMYLRAMNIVFSFAEQCSASPASAPPPAAAPPTMADPAWQQMLEGRMAALESQLSTAVQKTSGIDRSLREVTLVLNELRSARASAPPPSPPPDDAVSDTRIVPVISPELRLLPGQRHDSVLIPDTPSVLAEFHTRHWRRIYRGSVDGFSAAAFHKHCNGVPNTLTVVQSKAEGDEAPSRIFGGFTPVRWESRGDYKGEADAVNSFLFNLTPAKGGPPRRYPLRQEHRQNAIYCGPGYGPTFGNAHDLYICNNCASTGSSYTNCGTSYEGDRDDDTNVQFTLTRTFFVTEIEVFALE